jgi:hypothetical protein
VISTPSICGAVSRLPPKQTQNTITQLRSEIDAKVELLQGTG